MAKMTDDELRSVIDGEVAEAAAWAGSTINWRPPVKSL